MEERALYGPFVAESRLFDDRRDIGWRIEERFANRPHRMPLKPWMRRIGMLDRYRFYSVYRRIRSKLLTIRDIDDLHRRY